MRWPERGVYRYDVPLYSDCIFFFFQAEDGIRDLIVTGVQTCALPISHQAARSAAASAPNNNVNRFPGSRSDSARSVRTVYEGIGNPSSTRSTLSRGFPRDRKSVV